jgi:hypothetical protein
MGSGNILKISGVHVYGIIALQQDQVLLVYKTPIGGHRLAIHLWPIGITDGLQA